MDDTIHKLIALISPETYCKKEIEIDGEKIDLVKEIRKAVKEKEGYGKVLKDDKYDKYTSKMVLKPLDLPFFDYEYARADALNLWGLKSPMEQHKLVYDSPAEGLEPVYFWLVDFLVEVGNTVEKVSDNFISAPGSGHFSEMQGKATQMQQEASRTLGNVNTVLKSVLNLVYDLKEFRIRLNPYKNFKDDKTSADEKKKNLLSLKQIWLDNVDIRKGRGSINALSSGELDFVTLRDAFMSIDSLERLSKEPKDGGLDLNDRVKRILQQRTQEFFLWIDESYNSLKQRYEIEKNYLKSQVKMLELYSRWVRPYLIAAQKLEQSQSKDMAKNVALVTAFNTIILELKLFATSEYKVAADVDKELVPEFFKKINFPRKYTKLIVVEFEFRGIPQRVSQRDWGFGGRVEVKFTSYCLNDEELKALKKELENDDLNNALKLIDGATKESIDQIQKDIDEIINEDKKKEEKKEEKKQMWDDFGIKSLFSVFKIKKKEEKKDLSKGVEPDNQYEKVLRSQGIIDAREGCFKLFDTYKKGHGMPSHPSPFDSVQ